MATHSSVLAWRIPGTGEPDGLPSIGSHRVWHDWSDLAAAAAAAVPSCCVGPVKITPHLDFCLWTPSLRGLYCLNLQFWVHRERVKRLLPAFFFFFLSRNLWMGTPRRRALSISHSVIHALKLYLWSTVFQCQERLQGAYSLRFPSLVLDGIRIEEKIS